MDDCCVVVVEDWMARRGITKKYKGVGPRITTLRAEMKILRAEWAKKLQAKATARS